MTLLFSLLRKTFCLLFSVLFWLAGVFSTAPSVENDALRLEKEFAYLYSEGAAFCQGITTDGECFYATGCIKYINYNAIVKIDAETGDILRCNDMCLPLGVMAKGYAHLGDCCYHDGKIYAACEAFFFRNPAIMVFDAESLDFLEYHVLPTEGQGNGHIPWVSVKGDTIYYTQARGVDEVRMLNLSDFSYKGALKMDQTVTKITGGDLLGTTLYLSSNSGGAEKITYAVDLSTGETTEAFVRNMGNSFTAAEGLAIREQDGTVFFHYLDVPFFSKTIIRSYSLKV